MLEACSDMKDEKYFFMCAREFSIGDIRKIRVSWKEIGDSVVATRTRTFR